MGFFDTDMEDMLDIYLLETNQLLDQADEILLNAEQEKALTKDEINGIFRVMHTIKSSSAMMGLTALSVLAHRLEDIFAVFREGPFRLGGFEQETFDLVFAAADFIRGELGRMNDETFQPNDPAGFDEKIDALVSKVKDKKDFTAHIRFEADCKMENIRAYMVARQIKEECTEMQTYPENVESNPGTADYIRENGFYIHFLSENPGLVFDKLSEALFVSRVTASEEMPEQAGQTETSAGREETGQAESSGTAAISAGGGASRQAELSETAETSAGRDGIGQVESSGQAEISTGREETVQAEQSGQAESSAGREKSGQADHQEKRETDKPARPAGQNGAAQTGSEFIHVKVERLDELQNLTGELMIAAQAADLYGSTAGAGVREDNQKRQLERLLRELEELVISIRMIPFSSVVPQISRVVRDISRKENKKITFTVTGQDVEVDKKIADSILEPLLHLIRNAVDHGIETPEERAAAGKSQTGQITLSFENMGGEICVSVQDDGCGIDTEKVLKKAKDKKLFTGNEADYSETELMELCLLPGFSTREQANEFSGRGVGLDVVRQMVEKFGGHLHLESRKGSGSRFILHLPLTLTIIDSIRLLAGDNCFAVPARQVMQFFPYPPAETELVRRGEKEFWLHEGRYIPIISLRQFYDMDQGTTGRRVMAYVKGSSREACILADKIVDQMSLVEKPLPQIFGPHFRYYTGISGCSLLGDGSICMLLDIEDLIRVAGGAKSYE
ncbi:chemotaxis protein CheA [uncultured Clostridium sp.]|uniref:chemotaxis protein CheA n=1 Tax=uncultured Clostridium sp. TaxID=59620 RepID=UPI0025E13C9C|nr:chemotaxis protein CheA [uncultured Clostridium sp.]